MSSAGNFEGASSHVGVAERAGISRNSGVKCVGCGRGQRQVFGSEKFVNDLAGRGRNRIDVDEVAVSGIAGVMIDIDPLFRVPNRTKSRAQALLLAVSRAMARSNSSGSLGRSIE